VTPEELDLVSQAGRVVAAFPDRFAGTFVAVQHRRQAPRPRDVLFE
jgi:hypothetical protein